MRVQFSRLLLTFLLCSASWAAAQGNSQHYQPPEAQVSAVPDLQRIVSGLEQAQGENHTHMVAYTVVREYQLFADNDPQPKSTVLAEVRFQPPFTKTWSIKQATGTSRGEKIVKNVLEREARYARDGKIAISRQDYDFRYLGPSGYDHRPCYLLQITPKRNESDLLRGKIWVDRDTYLIHHFEGEPAKNPSWWIKDLKLSTNYSDLGGMWLANTSRGTADVRLFGPHTMTERTLSYQAMRRVNEGPAAELARLRQPQRPYRPSPAAAVGVGILTGR